MPPETESTPPSPEEVSSLRADCERCCGLCCVAPAFSASADFALDKDANKPCPNLGDRFRCQIHERLTIEGFRGCVAYECYGAGQKVTQVTFGGGDWRQKPEIATPMFEVFMIVRQLQELLMYLSEALKLPAARPLYGELREAFDALDRLTRGSVEDLREIAVPEQRRQVNALLVRVSELVRATGSPSR